MPLPPAEHDGFAAGVAFSLHGRVLATGGGDGLVRLWDVTGDDVSLRMTVPGHTDVRTGQPIGERLTGHEDALTHLAFSPSGDLLATASDDGTARLWPLTARTP